MSDVSCTAATNEIANSARHKIDSVSLKAFSYSWLMPLILSVISCAMVVSVP